MTTPPDNRRPGRIAGYFVPPGQHGLAVKTIGVLAVCALALVFLASAAAHILQARAWDDAHPQASMAIAVREWLLKFVPVSVPVYLGALGAVLLALGLGVVIARRLKPVAVLACAVFLVVAPTMGLIAHPAALDSLNGVPCGCWGGVFDTTEVWLLLTRNAVFFVLCLWLAWAWRRDTEGGRRTAE